MPFSRAAVTILAASALVTPAAAAPSVVASIKPVHALVSMVMGDLATPDLLLDGAASPHTYALTPSDAQSLEAADVVFWTGEGLEMFLVDAMNTLAADAVSVELSEVEGVKLLPVRAGGTFEAHVHDGDEHDDDAGHDHVHEHDHDDHAHDEDMHDEHDHEGHDHDAHEEHDHSGMDMHVWLDPDNATAMLTAIAETLAEIDPENAEINRQNAEAGEVGLTELSEALADQLSPVADKPFVVFHDAYHYFEDRFGLTVAGSITVSPDIMPGARRISELRDRVSELGATCVFAEPQFEPAIVDAIVEGTKARTGVLDPEGGTLTPGADLYRELMQDLADSLVECLGPAS